VILAESSIKFMFLPGFYM